MTKQLILLALFLYSAAAVAGGKLVYKPEMRREKHETAQMLGLEMSQPIAGPLVVESFMGGGVIKGQDGDIDAGTWYKTDTAAMIYIGNLSAGVGYAGTRETTMEFTNAGYAKVAFKLW